MAGTHLRGAWKADTSERAVTFVVAVLFILGALLLRIAVTPFALDRVPRGDPQNYVRIAENIMNGLGMSSGIPPVLESSRAHFPPFYPLLLSVVGMVAPLKASTFTVLNWLTDLATAGAMLLISRKLRFERSGLIAAAIYLVWPTNLLMAPVAHKEALAALLTCSIVVVLLSAAEAPTFRHSVILGILSALLALTQPALATLPALLALALLSRFPSRQKWMSAMVIATLVAAIAMLPWWIRNYVIFERFIPLTDSSAIAFWIGTVPSGSGNNWFPLTPELLAHADWNETSRAAFREAVDWIAGHPAAYVQHIADKAFHMLGPDRWNDKPLAWMLPAKEPPLVFIVVPLLSSTALFAGSAIGGVLARGSAIRPLVAACLVQLFVVQIWFEFPERHRYFMMPLLMILAVEGARLLVDDLKRLRRARRLGASKIV